ncbi:MAG TPA: MBL fold metallo-hydrolase [Chthonomonadales bacterium]|nr:MBL fold metallo-hydrolase [Chthonomonadales bacterium]
MRVKLLGTGAAEGLPGLFCCCSTCKEARRRGGKDLRSRCTALIDDVIKIDLPPDTLHHVLAQGLDMTQVRYLLITHSHDDHYAPLELQYASWMFAAEPPPTIRILAPEHIGRKARQTLDLDTLPLAVETLLPWVAVRLERWVVTPVPAFHMEEDLCFNYIVEDDERSVLYATDTGWYPDETWDRLAGRHLSGLVVECTKGFEEGGYERHLSIPQVVAMRRQMIESGALAPDARVVTTHHSHMAGMLHADLERALTPHGIEVGYDGFVFCV